MEAFHTNTRNHSWLARGRGAKPWDHTRPTYPKLPPQCVCHAPETTNILWKIKHSQKNTNRHTRYSLTRKDDLKHTQKKKAATSAAKVKLNVTATLLTYLFGEKRTLGTLPKQEIHEKTTQIHKSSHIGRKGKKTNARAELLLLVHGKQIRLHVIARPTHVTLGNNIRSQFATEQWTSVQ